LSGQNARPQGLEGNKGPHVIWTRCMLLRQTLASTNISEDLHIISNVIKFVDYVKKESPERKTLHSYVTIWRQNTRHSEPS